MRTEPEDQVVRWFDRQPAESENCILDFDSAAAGEAAALAAARQKAGRPVDFRDTQIASITLATWCRCHLGGCFVILLGTVISVARLVGPAQTVF